MPPVSDLELPRLPRGRHGLSRGQVEEIQRLRIMIGMADAMRAKGYVGTPVAEIIKRAGVSRETFYQLYTDKLDCFLAAFDLVGELLAGHLQASVDAGGEPMERFERALTAYLDVMVSEPAYSRLFLVEVFAAGPEAMVRRAALQDRIVDALADIFGARSKRRRFSCHVIVSAVSAMVTGPLVSEDLDAIRALRPSVLAHVRAMADAGLL